MGREALRGGEILELGLKYILIGARLVGRDGCVVGAAEGTDYAMGRTGGVEVAEET